MLPLESNVCYLKQTPRGECLRGGSLKRRWKHRALVFVVMAMAAYSPEHRCHWREALSGPVFRLASSVTCVFLSLQPFVDVSLLLKAIFCAPESVGDFSGKSWVLSPAQARACARTGPYICPFSRRTLGAHCRFSQREWAPLASNNFC